jgi:uracil-DNA glycosylase
LPSAKLGGADEAAAKRPFVGKTGQMMNWLFEEAGLIPAGSARAINRDLWQKMYRRRDDTYAQAGIHLTNVLNIHPPGNKIPALCQKERVDALPGIKGGQYLRAEFYPHLERLKNELLLHRPNVIIGLGAVASWFLLRDPRITKIRGAVAASPYGKVLPTFHPAYLLRGAWKMRPVVTFDLIKAGREAEYPDVRRPPRFVYIPESPDDIEKLYPELNSAERISLDIETVADQITCIGFAWNEQNVLVIPIFDWRQENKSYWSHNEESAIWGMIKTICELPIPKIVRPKVMQNGLYDIHFLWRKYGIAPANCEHDTMLLHHALHPEMLKGLGFLGSLYTSEPAWKLMRPKGKQTLKDEREE